MNNREDNKKEQKAESPVADCNNLNLVESRIVYFAILRGKLEGKPFSPVTLSVNDFRKLLNLKGRSSYAEIKKLADNITRKKITYEHENEQGQQVHELVWVKKFHYNEGEGTVYISLNHDIAKLWEDTPYTEMDFIYLMRFRCQYTERIYALLCKNRKNEIAAFSLPDLKKNLALDENKYTGIYELKRRVLNPAIKDINDITDLVVTYEEIKGGYMNRTRGILFKIGRKGERELLVRSSSDRILWL